MTAYRSEESGQARVVRYGPFPLRWGLFGVATAFLVIALGLGLAGTLYNELHCSKETCSLLRHGPFGTRLASFPPRAIRDVRVVRETGKSASYSLALIDGRGAETRLARTSKESELDDSLLRARAFFVDGRSEEFHVVEPRPTILLAVGVVLFGIVLFLVRSGFRGRGTRRLVVDDRRITVERGLLRKRSESFPLPTVAAIEVERGTIPDPWKSRGQPDEAAARIVVVGTEGERIALSEDLLPGVDAHERAATVLREVFGLAPRSLPVQATVTTSPFAMRILALFAFEMLASIVGNLLLRSNANRTEGTLEVQCTNRCKFQGMECMPGGSWGTTLKPGTYSFEVFDSSSPTQWTTRTVTIKQGETTTFACTPR
ncbi:MAG: hypothetical protein ACXWUG_30410 [Polyangiales bacterium]